MGFKDWSTTAANNANADPTINWAEGMSPSSVNDSARAMMARLAEYRDDIGGNATTGTTTAYVLLSTQGDFTADADSDKFTVAFVPNATNDLGPVTINVDGAGDVPLRQFSGVDLAAGVIVAGSVYEMTYSASGNEFLLRSSYQSQFEVPIGAMLPFCGTTAPNANFAIPRGQAISRTTYAALFALIGTTFGSGDGVTTFNIPDMRGRIAAGDDSLGGTAAGRLNTSSGMSGNTIGSTGGEQTHTLSTGEMPAHKHTLTDPGHDHDVRANSTVGSGDQTNPTNRYLVNSTGTGIFFYTSTANANMGATTTENTGITMANTGGGNAHNNVQPTLMVYWILRIK